jgi:hypothetical protein
MTTATDLPDRYHELKRMGGIAHQLLASVRAADRFIAMGPAADRDTACWLVSGAVTLAQELASDLDVLGRQSRDSGGEPGRAAGLAQWRMTAHQLHAACRAADLFLEQESRDDHDTGTWLLARALGLADRLTSALDDGAGAWAAERPRDAAATAATAPDVARRINTPQVPRKASV